MQMKVMLVDDHILFMEGLQYVLKTNGIEVIGTAKNGKEAFEKARKLKPDIVLMDIRMPEYNGLDTLRVIKADMPKIKVVMLTISEDDEDLFNAIKYGASGYMLKSANAKELINMLSDIMNNEAPVLPGFAARLLKEFRYDSNLAKKLRLNPSKSIKSIKAENLTERQLEVLEMVAKGVTYKEAGEALGLTERTVKYHMGRIIELLHLENRAQVIAYAAKTGLVDQK